MNYFLLIFFTIFFRLGFDVFVSKAGGKINGIFSNAILSSAAAIIPLLFYFLTRQTAQQETTKQGVIYSLLAGLSVGIFTVLLLKIFERGEFLSIATPMVYGGTLIGAALVGWFIFKEPVNLLSVIGVCLIALGTFALIKARII